MNNQIRKVFLVNVLLVLILVVSSSLIQVFYADSLATDGRNSRIYLHAASSPRGSIYVEGKEIAYSSEQEDSSLLVRTYSDGELFSSVTGFFSAVNSSASGLEEAYNDVLSQSSLSLEQIVEQLKGNSDGVVGVSLTLDYEMQQAAALALEGKKGAVVAIQADTGKILAMYSSPSYDPNLLSGNDSATVSANYLELLAADDDPLQNRAIASDLYPPGSTFKIITTIALLEQGASSTDTYESPVSVTLPGTTTELSNIEESTCGNGNPTLAEAFARSCNTTFALASQDIEAKDLGEVASRFGFGDTLSIPLQVTPSSFPEDLDAAQLALSAIGQYNVRVTPLQMAMVAAGIANGGVVMQPYLVDCLVNSNGAEYSCTKAKVYSNAVSQETAQTITAMMQDSVYKSYGTARSAAVTGLTVAAKTGTAEVGTHGYTLAWTVAFADLGGEQGTVALAVVVEGDEADPDPHGGTVAAPLVAKILQAAKQEQ